MTNNEGESPHPDPAPTPPPNDAAPSPETPPVQEDIRYLDSITSAPATPRATRPATATPPATPPLQIKFTIPNAMMGKPYDGVLAAVVPATARLPEGYRPHDVSIGFLKVEGLESLGLKGEIADQKIRIGGTPTAAGDFPIDVHFKVALKGKYWTDDHKSVTLTINPDPRSLWKERDSDANAPFRCEHQQIDRIDDDKAVLIAASRRGRSHANKGDFRDDKFEIYKDEESGWYAIAVADGAGSAPVSRRGAALATATAIAFLKTSFREQLNGPFHQLVNHYSTKIDENGLKLHDTLTQTLGDAMRKAQERIADEAKAFDCPIEHFATTLLLTIAQRFEIGWFAATIAVGDGGVVAIRKNGGIVALSKADSGEFAGQTRFLTMPKLWDENDKIRDRVEFAIIPDLLALIAMTDGVSDPKFPTDHDFADSKLWQTLWSELESDIKFDEADAETRLLDWLQFWAVGSHDDRTIAILRPWKP